MRDSSCDACVIGVAGLECIRSSSEGNFVWETWKCIRSSSDEDILVSSGRHFRFVWETWMEMVSCDDTWKSSSDEDIHRTCVDVVYMCVDVLYMYRARMEISSELRLGNGFV